jgi:hypothetical protein
MLVVAALICASAQESGSETSGNEVGDIVSVPGADVGFSTGEGPSEALASGPGSDAMFSPGSESSGAPEPNIEDISGTPDGDLRGHHGSDTSSYPGEHPGGDSSGDPRHGPGGYLGRHHDGDSSGDQEGDPNEHPDGDHEGDHNWHHGGDHDGYHHGGYPDGDWIWYSTGYTVLYPVQYPVYYPTTPSCSVWTDKPSYRVGEMITLYYYIPSSTSASLTVYLPDQFIVWQVGPEWVNMGTNSRTLQACYPTGPRSVVLQTANGCSSTCYFTIY